MRLAEAAVGVLSGVLNSDGGVVKRGPCIEDELELELEGTSAPIGYSRPGNLPDSLLSLSCGGRSSHVTSRVDRGPLLSP